MTRLAEPIPVSGAQALPGRHGGKPRVAAAVALCFWLLLAVAVGGCQRRAPAPQDKGGKSVTEAPTGADKSGKAPAKPTKAGKAPANAPAGAAKGGATDGAAANAPASTVAGSGAGAESPFPGQSRGTRAAAQAGEAGSTAQAGTPASAPPEGAKVVVRRDPDTIPGVPKLSFPAAKRSPFRLEGESDGPSTAKQTEPGMPIRPQDLGKAPRDMAAVRPLPPVPYALQGDGGPGSSAMAREGEMGAAAAPPPPALHLTGIINGAPRMAVIEGEKAHYIVREGDLIAGGYRVASISPYKVVLLSGDSRSLVLRFGRKGG